MLRYYQEDAKTAVQFSLEEYDRTLLHLPTGAGKTLVAAHSMAERLPGRCLFLADQDELCTQPLGVIHREANIIPALEKAKQRAPLTARMVVASSQTLARKSRLERYPHKFFDLAFVDEAHRGSDRDLEITNHLAKKVCGITATPFRANLRDLSKYYSEVAYSLPMLDLIGEGFAPPLKVLALPVEIDLEAVETKRGFEGKDYDAETLSTTIEPYYRKIAELLKEHAKNRHTIVFLPLIKSSEAFAVIARSVGITARHVDGNSPDRDAIIEGFRRGQFQMLCNANVIETGVDIPDRGLLRKFAANPFAVRYQQGVGRVLRVLPGVIDDIPGKHQAEERRARIAASAKPDCLIVDLLWQHDELGTMRPGHLVARNEEDARAICEKIAGERSEEDLQRIAQMVLEERENLLVKRLEEVATRASKCAIEPAAFGYIIGSREIMDYDPISGWEVEKPTPAQINKLAQWGIDSLKVETKGMASKLMAAAIHRFKFKLASIRQLQALKNDGAEFDPQRLTMSEASNLIARTRLQSLRSS